MNRDGKKQVKAITLRSGKSAGGSDLEHETEKEADQLPTQKLLQEQRADLL